MMTSALSDNQESNLLGGEVITELDSRPVLF